MKCLKCKLKKYIPLLQFINLCCMCAVGLGLAIYIGIEIFK
jgi:hypothetical protein